MRQDFIFNSPNSESIYVSSYSDKVEEKKDCLIFVHGFKGFKDWGFGPYLGKYFAQKGFYVLTFNFTHNGIEENPLEFTRLDKFEKNTFTREVKELCHIIDVCKSDPSLKKIGIIGHSRGGAISVISASIKKVAALCTWASISKIDRFTERQKKEWRKNGILSNFNARTKQEMNLGIDLLNDIENNHNDSLSISKAVAKLTVPYLVIHGSQDLVVSVKEAEQLCSYNSLCEKYIVKGTGHTFDIKHPFEGTNKKFDEVLNKTFEFFNTNL